MSSSGAPSCSPTSASARRVDACASAPQGERAQKKARKDEAAERARHDVVHVQKRPLTLEELHAQPRPKDLNQKLLRLYCVDMGVASYGAPDVLCARLAARLEAAGKTEYRAGDALPAP